MVRQPRHEPLAVDTRHRRLAREARELAEDLMRHQPVTAGSVAGALVELADLLDDWPVHRHALLDTGQVVEVPVTQAVWDGLVARAGASAEHSCSPGE